MDAFWKDLRFSLRQLRKSPGFTLTAVLTLAFGIGATTAIFSIVEGVLLRPLPFPAQSNLVVLGDRLDTDGVDALPAISVSAREIETYRRELTDFTSLAAYASGTYELSGVGDPSQINASRLNAETFPVLSVAPLLGRTFTQQEETEAQKLAVISYQTWQSRFHGAVTILGQKILLDRVPYEVIGVMPRQFEFPLVPGQLSRSELWIPLSLKSGDTADATSWNYRMIGRLKPGISIQHAVADAVPVSQEIVRNFPPAMAGLHLVTVAERLDENTTSAARPLVRTLLGAVTVVLFIACANLAGLLLVRVIRRRREIAVRLALGASGTSIVRQALIESLTLSVAGGLFGLILATVALRIGVRFLPETLPRLDSIGLDWNVVLFALALAVVTGLVCGVAPAFAASRTPVNDALKEGGRTGSSGSGHARLRSALVVAEVAVALVLLVASGLLLRSFEKLRQVDLGFRTDHTLTASYSLPHQQYSSVAAVDSFNDRVIRQLSEIPGVQAVGITSQLPTTGQISSSSFAADSPLQDRNASITVCWGPQLLGDYFKASGVPLLRGRAFNQADRAGAPLVVIINKSLADHYWPGQDPIGKRLHWGLPTSNMPWLTIVGVIGNLKQSLAEGDTLYQVFTPGPQYGPSLGSFAPTDFLGEDGGSIVLRTALPPEQMTNALIATIRSIDPRLPLTQVETMDQMVDEGQAPRRFNTALISAFAGAAVLLALLGIYSVIAFSATLRTQEMAIRLALGGQRSGIMRLILVSGAKLGLLGCAIGAIVAFFATRLLSSFLFQVSPLDPLVLVLAATCIFLLALAASLIPARRAALTEPTQALRAQ